MISIVIPTLNEDASIVDLLKYLKEKSGDQEYEIIVSDGGSTDRTVALVVQENVRVIQSDKGRAKQMNAGAEVAKGNILYFLHADTFPPPNFIQEIEEAYSKKTLAGCFRLQFDNSTPLLRFYAWFTKFDIDLFRFGDQSLFVDSQIFKKVGGFDEELIVMEDQELVKTLKKQVGFKVLKNRVTTSSRKYFQVGVIKLQIVFAIILIMYYLGVSQEKLVKFYKGRTKPGNVTIV